MLKRLMILIILGLTGAGTSHAIEFLNTSVGDGGDSNAATFHFSETNTDFQMLTSDGQDLISNQVPAAYGSHFEVYIKNEDIVQKRDLSVIGATLSGTNWTDNNYPLAGQLAIDVANGRIKFSSNLDWKAVQAIDGIINNPEQLQIKMNNKGQALAVYAAHDGSAKRLYAIWYVPGFGWQAPEIVDNGSLKTVYDPNVAINENGDAMIAFSQGNTASVFKRAHVRRFSSTSQSWFAVEDISTTNNAYSVNSLKLAMNNNGHAVVVYHQAWFGAYSRVFANVYQAGSGWQGNKIIDHDPGTACLNPEIDFNDNDRMVCSYVGMVSTWLRLYANQGEIDSGWDGALGPLDNEDAVSNNNVQTHRVGIDPYDEIILIYTQILSANIRMFGSYYYGGNWKRSDSSGFIDGGSPVRQYDISLSLSNSTTAICASSKQSGENIHPKHYSATTHSWSNPSVSFSEEGTGLDVATDINGNGFIVFRDRDVPGNKLVVKSYDQASNKWLNNSIILSSNSPTAYAMASNDHQEMITIFSDAGKLYSTGWQRDIPMGDVTVRYHGASAGTVITPTVTTTPSNLENYDLKGKPALAYPNPATDQVRFLIHLEEKALTEIKIFNMRGEQVGAIHQLLEPGKGQVVTWDCPDIAPGIYLAKLYFNRLEKEAIKISIVK